MASSGGTVNCVHECACAMRMRTYRIMHVRAGAQIFLPRDMISACRGGRTRSRALSVCMT